MRNENVKIGVVHSDFPALSSTVRIVLPLVIFHYLCRVALRFFFSNVPFFKRVNLYWLDWLVIAFVYLMTDS